MIQDNNQPILIFSKLVTNRIFLHILRYPLLFELLGSSFKAFMISLKNLQAIFIHKLYNYA